MCYQVDVIELKDWNLLRKPSKEIQGLMDILTNNSILLSRQRIYERKIRSILYIIYIHMYMIQNREISILSCLFYLIWFII